MAFVLGHLEIFKLNKKLTVGRCLKKNQAWVPQGKTIIDRWALAVCLSVCQRPSFTKTLSLAKGVINLLASPQIGKGQNWIARSYLMYNGL